MLSLLASTTDKINVVSSSTSANEAEALLSGCITGVIILFVIYLLIILVLRIIYCIVCGKIAQSKNRSENYRWLGLVGVWGIIVILFIKPRFVKCSNCSYEFDPHNAVCPYCGNDMKKTSNTPLPIQTMVNLFIKMILLQGKKKNHLINKIFKTGHFWTCLIFLKEFLAFYKLFKKILAV